MLTSGTTISNIGFSAEESLNVIQNSHLAADYCGCGHSVMLPRVPEVKYTIDFSLAEHLFDKKLGVRITLE